MAEIIDISVIVQPEMPIWPGDPGLELLRTESIADGAMANVSRLTCSVHTGTHVDAPLHFIDGESAVEELDLNTLVGPALVVDLPGVAMVSAAHLQHAPIPPGTRRLLLRTGNSQLWADGRADFFEDFVALTADAAQWIVDRGIQLIGVDYLSVQGYHDGPQTHLTLLGAGLIILEGVNLSSVEPGPYELVCLPLKLKGSDGAPARAILIRD